MELLQSPIERRYGESKEIGKNQGDLETFKFEVAACIGVLDSLEVLVVGGGGGG